MQKDQIVKAEDKESTIVQDSESTSTEQDHFYHNRKKTPATTRYRDQRQVCDLVM